MATLTPDKRLAMRPVPRQLPSILLLGSLLLTLLVAAIPVRAQEFSEEPTAEDRPPSPEDCDKYQMVIAAGEAPEEGLATNCLLARLGSSNSDVAVAVDQEANILCVRTNFDDVVGSSCVDADTPLPVVLMTSLEAGGPNLLTVVDPQGQVAFVDVDGESFEAQPVEGTEFVRIVAVKTEMVPERVSFVDGNGDVYGEAYVAEVEREFQEQQESSADLPLEAGED